MLSLFSSSFYVYLQRQTRFYCCCYTMFSQRRSPFLKRNMFLQLLVAGRVVLLRLFVLQLPGGVVWNSGHVTYLAKLLLFFTLFQFCVTLAEFLGLLCCNITRVDWDSFWKAVFLFRLMIAAPSNVIFILKGVSNVKNFFTF